MVEEKVRLRYSGFILFLSRLISIGTGLLFVFIVTRNITTEEFGLFGNMGDILGYFTLAAPIIPFWTTRFLARKHVGVSETGLSANLLISVFFSLLYLSLFSTIMSVFQINEVYKAVYAILTLQIAEIYAISELEAILQTRKPHLIGFGFLIYEASKVVAGLLLIIGMDLGLLGAVWSIVFAHAMQLVFYLRLTLHELRSGIRWSYVKEWIKASPFNLYSIIGERLAAFVLILLFMYGGELSRAYYGAASTIANIIGYSSILAYALYPRLLSRSNPEDVYVSLRMVLTFMIPMTVGAIVLANSYLSILNPIYRDARLVLIILSVYSALLGLSQVFTSVVVGSEKLDAKGKIVFKELVRSKLFLVSSLPHLESALTLPLAYFLLTSAAKDAVGAATVIASMNLVVCTVMLLVRYATARKCMKFGMPWGSTLKYVAGSIVMATVLLLFPSPMRLSTTLALTLLGVCAYFAVLLAIDRETRETAMFAKERFWSFFGKQ